MKAGNVLGEDVSEYETLYKNIVAAFQETWPVYHTQTECILAAHFHLAKDCQAAADQLALSDHKRRNDYLGALGRYYGKRRFLDPRHEFL